jgi:hypothetical protein
MTFTALAPMLWTDRLEETIDFYTRILKFTCLEKNEDWGWASLKGTAYAASLQNQMPTSHFTKPCLPYLYTSSPTK